MTNKKTTKRALLSSLLSLVLCLSMLIGTTFAWFTDSVTSANNIIKSGNLDVELYYQAEGQNDWKKVTDNTNIFKENALWEPGHTEVVKLKVVNEGSLALKYTLGVNVASEVGSVNVNNEEFKLSDYIKFGIVDGAQDYTRDTAIAAVDATATALKYTYTSDFIALEAENDSNDNDEKIITMVVYMPTTVGNEANHKKDATVPTINLGINLFATQLTSESDSFDNQYDADAPFSKWDGTVPAKMPKSLVVDGATNTIHVKDAAAFAYLSTLTQKWAELYTDGNGREYTNYANGAGENYYYRGRWTVSIETDIDLKNKPIEPVRLMLAENAGIATLEGNNHVIRNINTTTGLFADNNAISYSNLVLENVTASNGALAGSASEDIANVTVKKATISGTDYVGGLVGYAYGNVKGCKVIDSSVVATGKEAGGLIGYVATSKASGEVADNIVQNVTVFAGNRAAGFVAQANVNVKVTGNIIDTVKVGAEDQSKYAANAVVSNAIVPGNVYDNTVKNADVITESTAIVSDDTELSAAINAGNKNIMLTTGEYSVPANSHIAFVGMGEDTVIDLSGVIHNANISDVTVTGATEIKVLSGESAVFNNVVFDSKLGGATKGQYGSVSGKVTFVGCTFEKMLHFDTTNNASILIDGCTFGVLGTFKMGTGATNIVVKNTTFKNTTSTSIWGEKGVVVYCPATFTNCEFNNRNVLVSPPGQTVTFNSCTMNGGSPVYYVDNTDGIIRGGNVPNIVIN